MQIDYLEHFESKIRQAAQHREYIELDQKHFPKSTEDQLDGFLELRFMYDQAQEIIDMADCYDVLLDIKECLYKNLIKNGKRNFHIQRLLENLVKKELSISRLIENSIKK